MKSINLDQISFTIDLAALQKRLHVREGSQDAQELSKLAEDAARLANPRAYYQPETISSHENSELTIAEVTFHSRVLSVNLAKAETVFPFVATCGMELQTWGGGLTTCSWSIGPKRSKKRLCAAH